VFLIDTSAWVFALKTKPNEAIKRRVDTLLAEGPVATTGMILLELLGGTKSEAEYERLDQRLRALELVETRESVWRSASRLSFDLRRKGLTIPPTDLLIAACAMSRGATLLHADAHFDLAAKHSELIVESVLPLVS
jgi:hypothetical protein